MRPHLEYASAVWDPHHSKYTDKIEMVQRTAARFATRCYARTPGTVTRLLDDLNWPLLQDRRKASRLTLMYKAINNKIAIPIPEYLARRERRTRQYHPLKFRQLGSSGDTYKNSFFARTTVDWNALPPDILEAESTEQFKSALASHMFKS